MAVLNGYATNHTHIKVNQHYVFLSQYPNLHGLQSPSLFKTLKCARLQGLKHAFVLLSKSSFKASSGERRRRSHKVIYRQKWLKRMVEAPGNLPHGTSEFLISKPLGKCKI